MKPNKRLQYVQVRVCNNGWEVSEARMGDVTYTQVWVFETWDSLTEWLAENLEDNSTK